VTRASGPVWTICVAWALIHAVPAIAYRPFDSTDASVADEREFELEAGLGYLREGPAKALVAPAIVANFGLAGDREVVLEGKLIRAVGDVEIGAARTSLVDTALSLKQILRRGALQDEPGVSVASECGVLLPTLHAEHGTGATCALIASQRWPGATVHLNGALAFDRDHHWNRFIGTIVEGPNAWPVRPVAEVFAEQEVNGSRTRSALIGLIWRANEALSFDIGLRYAKVDDVDVREIRAGLTWTLAVGK
jgi:hypothetical protein